jgi:hypothetical protein
MSKSKEITPEEYVKARAILELETAKAAEKTRLSLAPSEQEYFICAGCLQGVYLRHEPTHYCMACHVPKTLFGVCFKCGQPLHIDNNTEKCLNRFQCK